MVSDVVVPPTDEPLTMSPLVSDSPPLFPPGARTNFGRTLFAPASSSTPAPSSVQAPPPAVSEAPGPAVTRGPPAVNGQLPAYPCYNGSVKYVQIQITHTFILRRITQSKVYQQF